MEPDEVVKRMFAAFAAGDEAEMRAVCHDDLTFVDPAASGSSFEEWLAYNRPFWTAFPDARMELENQVVAGNTVVSELRYTGVHSGVMATPQGEVPPTGREIDVRGVSIDRVEAGKIVSHHGYYDQLQFMTQLGLAGQPG
jgi:steroid delta-isomerase-like uncharacterized protein